MIEHGTYRGYQRCRLQPGGACQDCKNAYNKYMAEWRRKSPEKAKAIVDAMHTRDKALRILGRKHTIELNHIISDMKNKSNG